MPAPWRPQIREPEGSDNKGFNLKRDASPVATAESINVCSSFCLFQSQARCQPRGDSDMIGGQRSLQSVSISSEMPAPWRHGHNSAHPSRLPCFNLKRDASPVATTSIWADVSGAL